MTEHTVEAPQIRTPQDSRRTGGTSRPAALRLAKRYSWLWGAIALLLLSTLIVLWAKVRPGYDPYGWLVWGKLAIHWKLDTNGAPSWKPLPFLFTVPYALLGHYQLWLWMITAVAISLSGVVFAWRIAFRLTDAAPQRRYAAYAAGLSAGLFLLGINDYSHYVLSAQSDSMIVSLCLAAIDCQMSGRRRWAFWLWVLAALGRPEAWPFLGLYAIWLWFREPSYRRWIGGGLVLVPLLWFGIPALTSRSAFTAGNIAENSPRELHGNKIIGTLGRFRHLDPAPIEIAALLAVGLAAWRLLRSPGERSWRDLRAWTRRGSWADRWILLLAAGTILWVLVEMAFALHGWPAVPRYLFEPAGIVAVLGGVFVGRVVAELRGVLARVAERIHRPIGLRLASQLGAWGAVLVLVVLGGSLLPTAAARIRAERADLGHERARAREINRLAGVVRTLGKARILACGQPRAPIGYQSQLAWYLGMPIGKLYVTPKLLAENPHSLVNIYPLQDGWKVFPSFVTAATKADCAGLKMNFRS